MSTVDSVQSVVLAGTYLYAGVHVCDVRIVRCPTRYGSGDLEDPPDIANDYEQETFYVWFGSTTERGVFNAGGGGFPSLEEAITAAVTAPGIGHTVKWFT
jgi:hypothetical protein